MGLFCQTVKMSTWSLIRDFKGENMKKTLALCKLLIISLTLLYYAPAQAVDVAESRFVLPEYSRKISMDFKDANLQDVLKIFSQQSGLNFIAARDVADARITLYLDKVPVEQALERILHANNLTYEIEPGSGIFVVKPVTKSELDLVTRIYYLKHASVPSAKLLSTIAVSTSTDGGAAPTAPTGGGAAGGGIIDAIGSVLTTNGRITENPRTNSLIITDVAAQFPLIEETIAKLDVPIAQILIEVEMLDISKQTADLLGMKYGSTPVTFTGASRTLFFPWDQNDLLRQGRIEDADLEYTAGNLNASGLTLTLQFLRTQTDTKSLARPRILTLNNETAEIQIKTDEAIGASTVTSAAEGTATTEVEAERAETGVFLRVTPQANLLTGEITLAVEPKVIEARTGATFGGRTFKDPEERVSRSILRIRTGDTVMMGGLLRSDLSNTITKVPILGDLPLIGSAFRHKDKSVEDRELIIFITPHILTDEFAPVAQAPAIEYPRITREQDIPDNRLEKINEALTRAEKQKL